MSLLGHFDIKWGVPGPVGVRGVYIHVGLHTRGFLGWDHVDWSSIVYRFGGLHTYHNMPLGTPEAHSDQRLGLR